MGVKKKKHIHIHTPHPKKKTDSNKNLHKKKNLHPKKLKQQKLKLQCFFVEIFPASGGERWNGNPSRFGATNPRFESQRMFRLDLGRWQLS